MGLCVHCTIFFKFILGIKSRTFIQRYIARYFLFIYFYLEIGSWKATKLPKLGLIYDTLASISQSAGITGVWHHACLYYAFIVIVESNPPYKNICYKTICYYAGSSITHFMFIESLQCMIFLVLDLFLHYFTQHSLRSNRYIFLSLSSLSLSNSRLPSTSPSLFCFLSLCM